MTTPKINTDHIKVEVDRDAYTTNNGFQSPQKTSLIDNLITKQSPSSSVGTSSPKKTPRRAPPSASAATPVTILNKVEFALEMQKQVGFVVRECVIVLKRDPREYHPFYLTVQNWIDVGRRGGFIPDRKVDPVWEKCEGFALQEMEKRKSSPDEEYDKPYSCYLECILKAKEKSLRKADRNVRAVEREWKKLLQEAPPSISEILKSSVISRLEFFRFCENITQPEECVHMNLLWSKLLSSQLLEECSVFSRNGNSKAKTSGRSPERVKTPVEKVTKPEANNIRNKLFESKLPPEVDSSRTDSNEKSDVREEVSVKTPEQTTESLAPSKTALTEPNSSSPAPAETSSLSENFNGEHLSEEHLASLPLADVTTPVQKKFRDLSPSSRTSTESRRRRRAVFHRHPKTLESIEKANEMPIPCLPNMAPEPATPCETEVEANPQAERNPIENVTLTESTLPEPSSLPAPLPIRRGRGRPRKISLAQNLEKEQPPLPPPHNLLEPLFGRRSRTRTRRKTEPQNTPQPPPAIPLQDNSLSPARSSRGRKSAEVECPPVPKPAEDNLPVSKTILEPIIPPPYIPKKRVLTKAERKRHPEDELTPPNLTIEVNQVIYPCRPSRTNAKQKLETPQAEDKSATCVQNYVLEESPSLPELCGPYKSSSEERLLRPKKASKCAENPEEKKPSPDKVKPTRRSQRSRTSPGKKLVSDVGETVEVSQAQIPEVQSISEKTTAAKRSRTRKSSKNHTKDKSASESSTKVTPDILTPETSSQTILQNSEEKFSDKKRRSCRPVAILQKRTPSPASPLSPPPPKEKAALPNSSKTSLPLTSNPAPVPSTSRASRTPENPNGDLIREFFQATASGLEPSHPTASTSKATSSKKDNTALVPKAFAKKASKGEKPSEQEGDKILPLKEKSLMDEAKKKLEGKKVEVKSSKDAVNKKLKLKRKEEQHEKRLVQLRKLLQDVQNRKLARKSKIAEMEATQIKLKTEEATSKEKSTNKTESAIKTTPKKKRAITGCKTATKNIPQPRRKSQRKKRKDIQGLSEEETIAKSMNHLVRRNEYLKSIWKQSQPGSLKNSLNFLQDCVKVAKKRCQGRKTRNISKVKHEILFRFWNARIKLRKEMRKGKFMKEEFEKRFAQIKKTIKSHPQRKSKPLKKKSPKAPTPSPSKNLTDLMLSVAAEQESSTVNSYGMVSSATFAQSSSTYIALLRPEPLQQARGFGLNPASASAFFLQVECIPYPDPEQQEVVIAAWSPQSPLLEQEADPSRIEELPLDHDEDAEVPLEQIRGNHQLEISEVVGDLQAEGLSPEVGEGRESFVKCLQCMEKFCNLEQLRKHVEALHPEKCWRCPMCQMVMLKPAELLEHYKTDHGDDLKEEEEMEESSYRSARKTKSKNDNTQVAKRKSGRERKKKKFDPSSEEEDSNDVIPSPKKTSRGSNSGRGRGRGNGRRGGRKRQK